MPVSVIRKLPKRDATFLRPSAQPCTRGDSSTSMGCVCTAVPLPAVLSIETGKTGKIEKIRLAAKDDLPVSVRFAGRIAFHIHGNKLCKVAQFPLNPSPGGICE